MMDTICYQAFEISVILGNSQSAYPNLLGTKGYVDVVGKFTVHDKPFM
jgi:hypothetical protein